ncbi:MAG: PadR family transcriptional regulator [Dehalococcoidia bacterium]
MNEVERFVLLALLRLDEEAYAVPIRREIEERGGRVVSITAVYAALDRLERQGLVNSWFSDPLPERGGRARKHYRVLPVGVAALRRERRAWERMWEGLEAAKLGVRSDARR